MATKPKKQASYDLKAADRKRNLAIQIGLTAVVVIFAVALVLYIVMSGDKKPVSGDAKAIRVASSNVIKKEGSNDPKVVLSMYEDFLCPHCGVFEQQFGPTVSKLIDSGAVAADYYMVAILDRQGNGYSSRAANAAYCVADESIDAFRRFHAALYAQQPQEGAGVYPDNARLIEVARQAGAGGKVPDCINKGRYTEMSQGLAAAAGIQATPTIRINGQDYQFTTPDALVAKIKETVGDVPGLTAAPAAPAPTPPGAPPAQAPASPAPAPPTTPVAAPAPVPVPASSAPSIAPPTTTR
ncbi:protein-disulfide isomerase [Mycobacterium sp. JS623]|uniref:DsbA family protein n=1 Tax=Mycobacterium sp. JS623 TaxID=212767 RepID=UPI0002A5ADB5|nr:DsbA family protein [Mycobacterium sp. JS623]AGB22626.1 protein-disulfide isomerase [Mycobacterium sp. JS623]